MQEVWKDITGYEGRYQVSNLGRVKSLAKTWTAGQGARHSKADTFLKAFENGLGYFFITLSDNGKYPKYKVHRLVAQAFVPNPQNKPQVNHKDGNKANNNANNLEWTTRGENMKHAVENKLFPPHKKRKLTMEQVQAIREAAKKLTQAQLAFKYGIAQTGIHRIIKGETYKF